jgi:hypothetical protein
MLSKPNFSLLYCFICLFYSNCLLAQIKIHAIQNISSASQCDGRISVFTEGNTDGPYLIELTGPANKTKNNAENGVHTFDGLCKGKYEIKVTNNNSTLSGGTACVKFFEVTIGVCTAISIARTNSGLICFPNQDGYIDITASGGTPPYRYIWSNGKTTEDINNLEGNKTYKVVVTDNQGCSSSQEIKIEGQKIEATVEVLRGSTSLTPLGEIKVTPKITGRQDRLYYSWVRENTTNPTPISGYPNTTKFLSGNYTLSIHSDFWGCTQEIPFTILSCPTSNTPITLFSFDKVTNQLSSKYCNTDSQVSVDISGGVLPISYEFKDAQNKNIFPPNTLSFNSKRQIKLTSPTDKMLNQTSKFKASDKCGNSAFLDFNCDCNLSKNNVLKYNIIDGCIPDAKLNAVCGMSDNEFTYFVITGNSYTGANKQYEITFPDGQQTIIKTSNPVKQKPEHISGPKKWDIDKPGNLTINYEDQDGCKFDHTWFVKAEEDKVICDLNVKTIAKINPQTQLAQTITGLVVTNQLRECNACFAVVQPRRDFLLRWGCDENLKSVLYAPRDHEHPCERGGYLDTYCGLGNFDFTPINGWIEEVPSYANLIPSVNHPGLCEVECFCYFPENSLLSTATEAWFPLPRYIKTTKLLPNFKCEIPPKEATIEGSSSSIDVRCIGKPEVVTEIGGCRYEFRCSTTGELLRVEYHPHHCIIGEYIDSPCSDEDLGLCDFCPASLKLEPDFYHVVEYCDFNELCISDVDVDKLIVAENITMHINGATRWGEYHNPRTDEDERLNVCFPSHFGFKTSFSSSKVMKNNQVNKNNFIKVYPNPFNDKVNVKVNIQVNEDLEIIMTDILGRIIQKNSFTAEKGENSFEINFNENIQKGFYILSVQGKYLEKSAFQLVH